MIYVRVSNEDNTIAHVELVDDRYWDADVSNIEHWRRPLKRFNATNETMEALQDHFIYGWLEGFGQSDNVPGWIYDAEEKVHLEVFHDDQNLFDEACNLLQRAASKLSDYYVGLAMQIEDFLKKIKRN